MTDLRVIISGLILLTAKELYVGGNEKRPGAAVAITVSETYGSYDVEIPNHKARLIIDRNDVAEDGGQLLIGGSAPQRVVGDDSNLIVNLNGDRIRIGEYTPGVSPTCNPLGLAVAKIRRGELNHVPRFSDIGIDSFELAADAKPSGALDVDYKVISTKKVAAWLDFAEGQLAVRHRRDQSVTSEFRPSRHIQVLASEVVWKRETANDKNACIIIDPFADHGTAAIDVVIFLKSGIRKVHYANSADDDSGETHNIAAYDFEMYYNVLKTPPQLPPLPYYLYGPPAAIEHDAERCAQDHAADRCAGDQAADKCAGDQAADKCDTGKVSQDQIPFGPDLLTGINCGPARVP